MFGTVSNNKRSLRILKIKDFALVKGGKRLPKGEDYAREKTRYPYIRVSDMANHTINMGNMMFLKEETYKKIKQYTISSNDIYISIAGSVGVVGIVPPILNKANLTENAAKIVLSRNEYIDQVYLMWYLSMPYSQRQIKSKTITSGQPKLPIYQIENLEVLVPEIKEQNSFRDFVDSIDKLRFVVIDA